MRLYAFLTALLLTISLSMAAGHTATHTGSDDTTLSVYNTNTGGVVGYGIGVRSYNGAVLAKSTAAAGVWSEGATMGVYASGSNNHGTMGIWADANGAGYDGNTAVMATANADDYSGIAYGVSASASAFSENGTAYGIYADGYGGATSYSAYFPGNVFVGGYFDNSSDLMLKKNIRSIDGGLNMVMAMKPKAYEMKTDDFKGYLDLPKGERFGLIAQELETVAPNLVHDNTAPARLTPEERKNHVKKAGLKFKSVDYMGVIPILVQAIQELNAKVDSLEKAK